MSGRRRDATATAAVVHDPAAGGRELLTRALDRAGFWSRLEGLRRGRRRARRDLRIVIKPDLAVFDRESPAGTDPRLVEHLIDLLHERGYAHMAVVDAPGRASLWAENRDVAVLADLAGYRYVTDAGRGYEVLDLGEDLVELAPAGDGVLGGSGLGRAWLAADVRIGFAKNRTDEEDGYALGLGNLLGVLPLRDKIYHYRHRLQPADLARELLAIAPVHFCLIDAYVSSHGPTGGRRAEPLATRTIIASDDLLLGDWVGALKMGLDPYISRPHAALLRAGGLPRRYRIEGGCEPYPGWRNVPVLLRDSVRSRNRSPGLAGAVEPWLQDVNTELFPFRSEIDARLNALLAPICGGRPLEVAGLATANFCLGAAVGAAEQGRYLIGKDDLRRRTTTLGFVPADYKRADYEAAIDQMLPLAALAAETPPDRNGLRWRYLDGAVVFEYRQLVDAPYDEFVARVDIAAAVQIMNDNIGGARVAVARDASGRVIRQAERDIYLPQPNWLVLFGGDVIDVGKLDVIRYEDDRQRIFWRTVTSANASATYDDGIVTFARAPGDATLITIVARQKFTLPPAIEMLDLDRFPALKATLVSDAYTTYFSRTVANYLAAFAGRDPRIGRDWDPAFGEAGAAGERGPVALVVDAFRQLATFCEPWLMRRASGPQEGELDAAGFRHFPGPAAAGAGGGAAPSAALAQFAGDLLAALRRDLVWRGPAGSDEAAEDRQTGAGGDAAGAAKGAP